MLFPRSHSDSESKLLRPLLVFASTRTSFKRQEKVRADPVSRPRAHPGVSEDFSSESILNYDKLGGKRGRLLESRAYDYETFIFGKGASVITGCLLERTKRLSQTFSCQQTWNRKH